MIHVFLGTKAQLIKMAPIMRELQDRGIDYRFVFSGQHKNTIDSLRANFGVKKPDVCLYEGADITSIVKMFFWLLSLLYQGIAKKDYVWGNKRSKTDGSKLTPIMRWNGYGGCNEQALIDHITTDLKHASCKAAGMRKWQHIF